MKQKGNIIYDEKEWFIDNRSFDYLYLIQDILDRIDDFNNDEDINYAIDNTLIYYYQEWIIAKEFYNSPRDFNYEEALEWFFEDIQYAIKQIKDHSVKEL